MATVHAVAVRNVTKGYAGFSNFVLTRLNMTVDQGHIYALLGSSGCGKTTLLKCILNRSKLNSGSVRIFGLPTGSPECGVPGGRVGYMPQDICLHMEFQISELLAYFGRLHGMTTREIEEKTDFLIDLLQLPNKNRIVQSLSGGQQRRVSFAATLVHDPELLILDEPTVGVDPVLRQNIWDYLLKLVSSGNHTIIITTHYIEETKQANKVGIMRNGRLLAEDTPQNILTATGKASMEEALLQLCKEDDVAIEPHENGVALESVGVVTESEDNGEGVVGMRFRRRPDRLSAVLSSVPTTNKAIEWKNPRSTGGKLPLYHLWALFQRMALRFYHNPSIPTFLLMVPILLVVLFALCIGGDLQHVRVAIVNNEHPTEPICKTYDGCVFLNLSCAYLEALDHQMVDLVPYSTEEEAKAAVDVGKAWATLVFPANFSQSIQIAAITGSDINEEIILDAIVRARLDMSNQQIGFLVQRMFLLRYRDFMEKFLNSCDIYVKLSDFPVRFEEPYHGKAEPSFLDFTAPGILVNLIFVLSTILSTLTFIHEKQEKMLERTWIAGVTAGELLVSYVSLFYIIMLIQTAEVLIFELGVFQVGYEGSLFLVCLLSVAQGTCGLATGLLVATLTDVEETALELLVMLTFPPFLLSGSLWPREAMPWWLNKLSPIFHTTHASEAMRSIMARGLGLTHPLVWPGFVTTIAWTVGTMLVYWFMLRRAKSSFM